MSYFNLIQIYLIFIKQPWSRCCVRYYIDSYTMLESLHSLSHLIPKKVDIIILALRGETQTQRGLLICSVLLGPLHYTVPQDTIPMVVHANSTLWICVLGHNAKGMVSWSCAKLWFWCLPNRVKIPSSSHPEFSDSSSPHKKRLTSSMMPTLFWWIK